MTIEIPLTRGHVAIVDDCDADLADFKWFALPAKTSLYAARSQQRKTILMHRVILARILNRDINAGEMTDHINGNGLDNRRANLRPATTAENTRNRRLNSDNTSGFKGVGWHKSSSKWRAVIQIYGTHIHLGLFDTPEAAHEAYCTAAKEYFGEFFNPGTPPEGSE